MASPDLCTEEEIAHMVHDFYDRVRLDEILGPIFNGHISDWDHHLVKLVDFWSSILRGTGRFSGTPMPKHVALSGLNAELFRRWLSLFNETTQALDNQAMREQADNAAQRIAQSLWYGYQMSRNGDRLPADLGND